MSFIAQLGNRAGFPFEMPGSSRFGAGKCDSHLPISLHAAIQADAFIEGTELEGGDPATAVQCLIKSLENFKTISSVDGSKIEEVLAILNTLRDIPESKAELLQILPCRGKVLLKGGWASSRGSQGHTILYLVERVSNDVFNITLFNTGAGAEKHEGSNADSICPVQTYVNVPGELFGDDFLKKAAKLRCSNWEDYWRDWFHGEWDSPRCGEEAKYLYDTLFVQWQKYKKNEAFPIRMKGQKSGTCYYRAPLALIKSFLPNRDYKLFKYTTKRDAFFQLYQEKKGHISPTDALLIKESGEKLLRTIGKLYDPDQEQSLLSADEVRKVRSRINEILQAMAQITAFSKTEERQLLEQLIFERGWHPPFDVESIGIQPSRLTPNEIELPQQFLTLLRTLATRFNNILQQEQDGGAVISFEIEQLVSKLPMPDNSYWQGITQADIVPVLDKLYLLMLLYCSHSCDGLAMTVEKQNVLLHLLAIMYLLACKKDKELAQFGLNVDYFLDNFAMPSLFVCFDKEAFHKKMALIAFLQDRCKDIFTFCPFYSVGNVEQESQKLVQNYSQYLNKKVKQNSCFSVNLEKARRQLLKNAKPLGADLETVATILAIDDQILQKSDLEHARFLRQAEALSRLFCQGKGVEHGSCATETPLETLWDNDRLEYMLKKSDVLSCYPNASYALALHRHGGSDKANELLSYHGGENASLFELKEENFLREGNERCAHDLKLTRDLGSASVNPKLRPNALLAYFKRNFSELDPFYQTIFDSLLFKPYTIAGKWQVTIYEEAQKERFLKQCRDFINEGLEYCFERHAGKIDVHKALFFIRFCDRLRVLNPKAELPSLDEALEELLSLDYLDEFEKRAIHLQRIFHYSTVPQETLSDETLKKIVVSWFYFNKCPSEPAWDDSYLFWYASKFIFSLSFTLNKKMSAVATYSKGKEGESFRDSLLSELEKTILEEQSTNEPWGGDFPLFNRGKLQLNILKAQIHLDQEILSPPFGSIDPTDVHYQKLFKGELFKLIPTVGGFFSFDHPKFGKMRLRKISQQSSLEIHRQIRGKWYRYIGSRNDVSGFSSVLNFVPYVLLGKEYVAFVELEGEGGCITYLEPLHTDNGPSYVLQMINNGSPILYELDEKGNKKYRILPCNLPNFEEKPFSGFKLLDLKDDSASSQAEPPVQFRKFPRYKSLATGQALSFCGPNKQWEENRSFALQETRETGLLGRVSSSYLQLKDNKTGRVKILVPLQRVLPNNARLHNDSAALDVNDYYKNAKESFAQIPEFLREQIGIYSFIEFDVVNGKAAPLSTEGVLFKAYIELLQRNYVEAKELLNSIAHYERLSQESTMILDWILREGADRADFSPSAAAIRLSAAYLLYKDASEFVRLNSVEKDLRIYRKSYSSVFAEIRMVKAEQEFWGQAVTLRGGTELTRDYSNVWGWERRDKVKLTIPPSTLTKYEKDQKVSRDGSLELKQGRDQTFVFLTEYFEKELDKEALEVQWNFPKTENSIYADSLDFEYSAFLDDYEVGRVKNSTRAKYKLKSGKSFGVLKQELQTLYRAQNESLDKERETLLKLAKKPSFNAGIALRNEVLEEGHYFAPVNMNDLLNLFLLGDFSEYAKVCPYLSAGEIRKLDKDIQHFLLNALKVQKLERTLALSDNEKELDNLASELMAPLAHNIEERVLLIYEYRANIVLRLEQAIAIAKMLSTEEGHFKNLTLQMMMGGGKTSVLGSMWLYIAAHVPGRLAVFIPPTAQFETLKLNLGRAQKRNFRQDVLSIKMAKEDMTLENLEKIKGQIKATIASKGVLLITKETLQTLELELLYVLDHYSESVAKRAQESNQKRECLTGILNAIRDKGDFLIDESDLLLSPNLEVNLPISAPSNLRYEYVSLIETIYKLHVAQDVKYKERNIDAIIGLARNEQSTLDLNFYKQELQPVIAKALCDKFPNFHDIPLQHREAFVRYVCGQMNAKKLTLSDRNFIDYLEEKAKGSDDDKMLADQIALAKFFFSNILPITLTRSTGRSYGRSPQHPSGKVVPYLGVDTPSPTTEFGSPWIAAAYHFQTVLSKGISLEQVRRMIERFAKMAEQESNKKRCKVSETYAAKRFADATRGRQIAKIAGNEAAIKALWRELNQNTEDRLALERETVADVVQYYKTYLGSTAQDFVLQCSTVRTFSGTPWNYHCYGRELDSNVALEEGVEGSIVDKMLRKAQDKDLLHDIREVSIPTVLASVTSTKDKMVQSLIDAGGIFKNFDNERVACDLAEYFKDNPQIEYILFFGRKDPAEATPDHLMAIKRGFPKAIDIGSTNKEELKKRGITRENVFVYFDEKHCEATDLPLSKEGRGVVTMSARMDLRTQLQAIMRLREFFKEQDVEYVIPQSEKGLFFEQGNTLKDCVMTFLKNQGEKKTEQAYQSARQRIRAFIRNKAVVTILAQPQTQLDLYAESYQRVFKSELSDSPYKDYGELDEEVPVKEALQMYVEAELNKFTNLSDDEKEAIKREVLAIIDAEEKKGRLPKTVRGKDLSVDFQVAMERETETELETELQQELERYNTSSKAMLFGEKKWQECSVMEDLSTKVEVRQLDSFSGLPVTIQLSSLLKNGGNYGHFRYDKPYDIIFDDNIALTNNLALTRFSPIPVFNTEQKRAEQILVIKENEGLRYVLLSVNDAVFFKDWLEKHQREDMWLFLADRTQISNNPEPTFSVQELQQLNRMFVQVNIFNGQISYLDSHEDDFKLFLKEKDTEAQDILLRFLKLKVEKDSVQRSILYHSLIKSFSAWTAQLTLQDLSEIPPEQIPQMSSKWYRYLTRIDQIKAVPPDRVKYLIPSQIQHLTDEQVKRLEIETRTNSMQPFDQWVKEGSRIFNEVRKEQLHLLSADQLHQLGESRVSDVPDDRLKDLAPYQLKWLKKDKLNKVPNTRYGDLDQTQFQDLEETQVAVIPKQHVRHLNTVQISWLTTYEQCDEVASDNLQYLGEKLQLRTKVDDIPHELLCRLSKKQVQRLTDDMRINALPTEPHKMPMWLGSKNVPAENMLSWLTVEQLHTLRVSRLSGVPLNRLSDLSDNQIAALDSEMINKVPSECYAKFGRFQFHSLEKVKVKIIPEQYVPYLNDKQIPWLTTSAQFDAVAPANLQYLGAKLRQRTRVNDVPNELLCCLSKEQVQRLSEVAKINALPARVENMPEWLSRESEKPSNMISWLTKEQLKYLTTARMRDLPTERYEELDDYNKKMLFEVFGEMKEVVQIQALKDVQIQYLSTEAMKKLSPGQKDYVRKMTDAEALKQSDNLLKFKYSKGLGLRIHIIALRILQSLLFFISFSNAIKIKIANIKASCEVKSQILTRLKIKFNNSL